MQQMKPCRAVTALLAWFAVLALVAAAGAQAQERTISVGNLQRQFILHTPQTDMPGPWPLVIALHGALQPASVMQGYLRLDAIADREGFAVAYPKGINLLWNDGRGSVVGIIPILRQRDDAAFILAVLDTLVAEGIADPTRAYLMGFSNGGFMTAFMACRHAERFAAYATLMMTVPITYTETCRPSRPIPILMMTGTYDPIVPTFGRQTPGSRLMSAPQSAEMFARLNGCGISESTAAPNARIRRWNNCAEGSAVAFYEIEGGHQPPSNSVGAMDTLASFVLGPRRRGLDAPEEIWSFFRQFGRAPEPAVTFGLPVPVGSPSGPGPSAYAPTPVPLPVPSPRRQRTINTQ